MDLEIEDRESRFPMFPIYNALLVPLTPALGLYTLQRRFIQKKSAASFTGQWGHISPQMREFGRKSGPKIWLHAVSVGETMAAQIIARALKTEFPGASIALSSTTDAGHVIAQTLAQNGEIDLIFFFPLDLVPVQTRVLGALRPDALLLVETELWPNLLHLARKQGVATFLVNGRVSDNLLKTAPKLGPLWTWMSGNVSRFLMRSEADAARLHSLGVPREKIAVTGDVKLEAPTIDATVLRRQWRETLGLGEEPLVVAGSTHAGEEEAVLEAASQILGLKVALAPRQVGRADEVAKIIRNRGFEVARRSRLESLGKNCVYLLDSVGELADFYSAADVGFVGGSLIRRGGHNLLEPVLRGVPVVFGPHTMNFRTAADLILQNGLGTCVKTADELKMALEFWLKPENSAHYEEKKAQAFTIHQGAARRLAQEIGATLRR